MEKPLVRRGETENRNIRTERRGEKENRNGQTEKRKRIKEEKRKIGTHVMERRKKSELNLDGN